MTTPESFGKVLQLFEFDNKRELEKYCRNLTIDSEDFFFLIVAAQQGLIGYSHRIHHRDIVPKELRLERSSLTPIETDETGKLKGRSLKYFRKVSQIFRDRRYLVGHMFASRINLQWHLFYFDQRDHSVSSNHWEHGPHIHFINWLWPNHSMKSLWTEFISEKPNIRGALHIRYSDSRDVDDEYRARA